MPLNSNSYVAGGFALEISGVVVGALASMTGGTVYADVVKETVGSDRIVHKHLGGVKYEDITITCGVPSGKLAEWLVEFLSGNQTARDGAIITLDYSHKQQRRLAWKGGLITSVTFPRLESSSKDLAHLTITIRPESTSEAPASGSLAVPTASTTHLWRASNFSVGLTGIDCSKVAIVDELTVTQNVEEAALGDLREGQRTLGGLDVGNLVLTVTATGVADFTHWRDDFILKGHNTAADEKAATLHYLSSDLHTELMALSLSGLGISRLEPNSATSGTQTVARMTATLYCEQATLVMPKPAGGSGAAGTSTGGRLRSDLMAALLSGRAVRRDPSLVATRLVGTTDVASAPPVDIDRSRQTGYQIGALWAADTATLPELQEVASSTSGDWTALSLPFGHSLVVALQASGIVPGTSPSAIDLVRDPFIEGIVEGAAATLDSVLPHL